MHHFQRLCENSVHITSEAKTAIAHLIRLLVINNKLLHNLPRSSPPPLNSDTDIPACLSWTEDRLIALNEALTMDANRPTNASEENKPIAQRQVELAALVHNMQTDHRHRAKTKGSMNVRSMCSSVFFLSFFPFLSLLEPKEATRCSQ
jgi:hypothetical protein